MKKDIRTNDWLTKGISKEKLMIEKELSIIGARINLKRIELGMDQKEFAKFMGVSQGLVSRWESGSYNFTIANLVAICQKIDMDLQISMTSVKQESKIQITIEKNEINDNTWKTWSSNRPNIIYGGMAS